MDELKLEAEDPGRDPGEAEEEAARSEPFAALLDERWLELPPAWLSERPRKREYLLEAQRDHKTSGGLVGVIPMGKVGFFAGEGGVGKSLALIQLALCIATGRPWLERFHPPQAGRVLLAAAEEDAEELQRRIFQGAAQLQLNDDERRLVARNVVVLHLEGCRVALLEDSAGGELQESGFLLALRRRLDAGDPWRLLILDPFSRFAGGDAEKDNHVATRTIQTLETLLTVPGRPAVLVAHHVSQQGRADQDAGASAIRGVTGLIDGARWAGLLRAMRRPGGGAHPHLLGFEVVKSNYGHWPPPLKLWKDEEGIRPATSKELESYEAEKVKHAQDSKPAKITNKKTFNDGDFG